MALGNSTKNIALVAVDLVYEAKTIGRKSLPRRKGCSATWQWIIWDADKLPRGLGSYQTYVLGSVNLGWYIMG